MSVESNKAKAVAVLQDLTAGRIDLADYTEDATWWMQSNGEVAMSAYAEMTAGLTNDIVAGPARLVVHDTTAEGNRVAVEAESLLPLKDGGTYNNHYHFLIRFRDGKVSQIKEYQDTALAERTFGKHEHA